MGPDLQRGEVTAGRSGERLSTGIDALDEQLRGGPRPGTVLALTSPPASQTGPLFYALMAERPTTYITTIRGETAVRDEFDHALGDGVEVTIEDAGTKNPITSVNRAITRADERYSGERNIIVDSMNALERTNKYHRYVDLLNAVKDYLVRTGGLAVFHCTTQSSTLPLRELTLTVSDLVMDLDVVVDSKGVENHLTVPKFRGERVVDDIIKLKLGQEAHVDTSRNL